MSLDAGSCYNMTKNRTENSAILTRCENSLNREQYAADTSSVSPKSPLLDIIEPLSIGDTMDSLDVESHMEKYDAQNNKTQSLRFTSSNENETPLVTTGTTQVLRNNTTLAMPLPTLGIMPIPGSSLPPNKSTLPAFEYISPSNHPISIADFPLMDLNRVGVFPAFLHRRSRGEKRPIPEEQKDEKYYERRKRNNEAAKKSRDARKIREDRIAFRAALLEQENSILRAQVIALRDELQTMRRLIASGASTAVAASVLGATSRGVLAL
ncbi:hepatic leukemia factor [Eurosta solidaginis]|uniref:hepatic leukemia factor n=1 Tax=Eurosta solidaginis TaxID=178769 RepID=UPI00353150A6